MKNWLRGLAVFGGGVVALWALLYVVFWYRRTGCFDLFDRACNDGLIHWLERLVSLGWVREYQTLLAGLFALGAGFFVVSAAKITAEAQNEEARRRAREEAVSACAVVAARFTQAAVALQRKTVYEHDLDFTFTIGLIATLSKIDTQLATVAHAYIRDARDALIERKHDLAALDASLPNKRAIIETRSRDMAAQCYAMTTILYIIEENIDADGRFNFRDRNDLRPGVLRSNLNYLGVSPRALGALKGFFNWDDHSPRPK
ncbi:MAG TPA: hypothetical protein VNS12_13470 [Pelagibacterium sp.]|uniref:hypothetical protein n=1 Tax=Pelagibacterium sp. TaxID=1967288 RepID=UPI002B82E57A|nr:hypothetical protein [Pelagibacterium sp.]HWJ89072.1 hypothetical protein [Pelagibacterium sp.]